MLKKLLTIGLLSLAILSCDRDKSENKADNPLDGGRYFIENYMKGDFKAAKAYVLNTPQNQAYFDTLAQQYFGLDKEGRMQLRLASIQINEVSTVDSALTIINYQNSFDKIVHKVRVVSTPDGWKVDLKNSYLPKL